MDKDGCAITVQQLTKTYGDRKVLDSVSLQARAGSVVGLIGPNGAGKTTLIETLVGLRRVEAGSVRVLDQTLDSVHRSHVNDRVSLQTQAGKLPRHQSVMELMRLWGTCAGKHAGIAETVDLVGLSNVATSRVGKLSGGELQKLRLGLALVTDPDLLLLDEPTVALDPASTETVWALIRGRRESVTVFINTQSMEEAEQLCDHVYLLESGRVVAGGTPVDLVRMHAQQGRFVCRIPSQRHVETERVPGAHTIRIDRGSSADTLTVVSEDSSLTKAFLEDAGLQYKQYPPSLVDVFLCLTQERKTVNDEE